ncbi:MAG TPA: glycosyltransferase family 4 protein [Polyangiales bacterium]|nr:glycosyltransferase family 4 protein [Polyangiales bacterium]
MLFVVPGPEAPVSGGNRYNDALIHALGAARIDAAALDVHALASEVWVDSLYLTLLPRLRGRVRQLGLLAHSLPSLLAQAAGQRTEIDERALLGLLDCAVAPSETMRDWLLERAPGLRVRVVEPAVHALPVRAKAGALHAVLVANLLPNKGVLPFLASLASKLHPQDQFTLRVIGRLDLDREYAARCVAFAESRVVFVGGVPYAELLAEYARAQVCVSASRSESYGMAVAEARASGCIVLARGGGHVAKLLDPASDVLVESDDALVDALLELVRDPRRCAKRSRRALASRAATRSASDVAREFLRG